VIRLVEQNIQHAVERVSIERGYDPRGFTLVAAGGAGPLHGAAVARALGCAGAYIPRLAGVFCAFGMCNADVRHDMLETWLRDLDEPGMRDAMAAHFDALIARGAATLTREGFAPQAQTFQRALEMRYGGQQWTIQVAADADLAPSVLRRSFEVVHERLYGYHQPDGRIEVAALRLAAIGKLPPITLQVAAPEAAAPMPIETRAVWLDDQVGTQPVPVYDGGALKPGHRLDGPAVIDEATTTILVGPADRVTVTAAGNYHITWI
jgi:N-methylhydantoinase A